MVLRRILGPSLETGTVFDAVLSVNYCAKCDCVSVMAVQEKCDEKRQGARLGKPHARDGRGIPPFSQRARKGWGNRPLCAEVRELAKNSERQANVRTAPLARLRVPAEHPRPSR